MKCVLIIGGNCDIGRTLCDYFLEKDYNVVVGYYSNNSEYDSRIKYIKCDVTKEIDIDSIVKSTIELYEHIDVMINLSATYMDNSFLNKTKNEFMRVIEVNLVGCFLCNQIYSRYIDNGIIINMASTDGIDTNSEYSIDYSASKAGIINMCKSISLSTNNKILCICPNWVDVSSTNSMNKEYLDMELNRIGQSRLISLDEFRVAFDSIFNSNYNSGDVFRIDVKEDKLWVEKI